MILIRNLQARIRDLNEWMQDHLGVLIWIPPLLSVAVIVYFVTEVLDIERLGIYYAAIYTVTAVFCGWNIWDRFWDWRVQIRARRPAANVKLAEWRLRQNILIGAAATAAGLAGWLSTFMLVPSFVIVTCLFASGLFILTCAAWDRTNRWEVMDAIERERLEQRRQREASNYNQVRHELDTEDTDVPLR